MKIGRFSEVLSGTSAARENAKSEVFRVACCCIDKYYCTIFVN